MTYVVPQDCVVGDTVREFVTLHVVGKQKLLGTALASFREPEVDRRRRGWIYPQWVWEQLVEIAALDRTPRGVILNLSRAARISRNSLTARVNQVRRGTHGVPLCYREELGA